MTTLDTGAPFARGYYETCRACGTVGAQFYSLGMMFTLPCKCIQDAEAKKKFDTDSAYAGI